MSRRTGPTTAMLNALRSAVIDLIAAQSANDTPAICKGVGLADGTAEESFQSKAKYVRVRLMGKLEPDLISIGRTLLQQYESYPLSEALNKVLEAHEKSVSELTRRRIFAVFQSRPFSTEFTDLEFCGRTFHLKEMPSRWGGYHGHKSLEDDFFQATVRNSDWSNDDIVEALGLLTCSQRQFFRFLEAIVDPICQKSETQQELAAEINKHLRHDGYKLTPVSKMSGSPVYAVKSDGVESPANDQISNVLKTFDEDVVHARWETALLRQTSEPEGAITVARTLLEDVCKWIIIEAGETYEEKDDLPALYRKLAKILNIAPDNHTETIFKQILGSCQSIVESLGSLRNKMSDAHSSGPKRVKPSARHAQLAVNLSGSMATFLVLTWNERKAQMSQGKSGSGS